MLLSNPGREPAAVSFTFRAAGEEVEAAREIAPFGHLEVPLEELFDSGAGALEVSSSNEAASIVLAVVSPTSGLPMPAASAILSRHRGSLALSETTIPARSSTQNAWVPIDTLRSLIRHGHAHMSIAIANASRTPATLRFTLFDTGGTEQGFYEQIPARSQPEAFQPGRALQPRTVPRCSASLERRTGRVERQAGNAHASGRERGKRDRLRRARVPGRATGARVAAPLGRRWDRHRDRADPSNHRRHRDDARPFFFRGESESEHLR